MSNVSRASVRFVGQLAIAVGLVGFASVITLAVFFTIGDPFGAINDWSILIGGVLTGLLVLSMDRRGPRDLAGPGRVTVSVAVVGAAIVVVGAALVISRTTGFFLAGLVESVGFAMVGIWLVRLNRAIGSGSAWPGGLARLGTLAGWLMIVGFAVLPGIAMGLDDMDTAPGWIWVGYLGWLGIFFVYPAWGVWFGRALLQRPAA
ncbi:MAG: hypothetical protein ABIQ17_07380 [Candidatus Limnocylindrales bacterium]